MEGVAIRPFEPKDAKAFIGLGKWLQENSNYKECGFSEEKVFLLFVQVIEDPNYFGIVVEKNDEVIGALFGVVQEYYFSDKRFASDLGFGILPDHRHLAKTVLPRMMDAFEKWAKDVGAMEVTVATSSMAHGDKLLSLFNSIGYKTVGFGVKKRV